MRILCLGDICGPSGMDTVCAAVGGIKKLRGVDFVVANGENAQGTGILGRDCERLYGAGVDVITLGNHAFSREEIVTHIDTDRYLLRPANLPERAHGRGYGVFDGPKARRIGVVSLVGRLYMDCNSDSPFTVIDTLVKQLDTPIIIVDFHAEATSEKLVMRHHLDGRVSAVFGTHTHVQTADACVTAAGMGYITDVGMCGPHDSVIGMKPEAALSRFLGVKWRGTRIAVGDSGVQGVIFDVDDASGKCKAVEVL